MASPVYFCGLCFLLYICNPNSQVKSCDIKRNAIFFWNGETDLAYQEWRHATLPPI